MIRKSVVLSLVLVFVFSACQQNDPVIPKPRTYPRVEYPERNYIDFEYQACPFQMPHPDYFHYQKDSTFYDQGVKTDCWFDLFCDQLKSNIHFSYVEIENQKHFDELVQDAFELADKHNVKASYRDEILIESSNKNVHGVLFEISGPVATPVQFYVTDSLRHFLRGSLYFEASVNRDSIAPIYNFVKEDLNQMLGGFSWK